MCKTRLSSDRRQEILHQQQASGLSVAAFCCHRARVSATDWAAIIPKSAPCRCCRRGFIEPRDNRLRHRPRREALAILQAPLPHVHPDVADALAGHGGRPEFEMQQTTERVAVSLDTSPLPE